MPRILRVPWTVQPKYAGAVNPQAVSAGLSWLADFSSGDRVVFGSRTLARTNSGHVQNPTLMGMGVSNANTGEWSVANPNDTIAAPSSASFAVMTTFRLNSTGQTNKYMVFQRKVTGLGSQTAIIYGYVANKIEFYATGYGGSDPRTGSQITVNDTLPHTVLYTYDGSKLSGWLDGVLVADTSVSFSVASDVNDTGALFASASGAGRLDGTILLHAIFKRGLPSSLAKAYSSNPWQIFAPANNRLYFDLGAGGAITIDCSSGNAVAAGTTATLSLPITIACSVGNAAAAGVSASVTQAVTINTTVGNAVAAGVTAAIELGTTITVACSVGNAVAAGVSALITQAVTINGSVGNAVAAGITASITLGDPLHGFTQDQLDFLVAYMEANMSFPTAADIVDAVYAGAIDGTTTFAESIRLHNSVLAGKVSGAGTGTEVFRDLANTKDRVVATTDSSGNRTAITLDVT